MASGGAGLAAARNEPRDAQFNKLLALHITPHPVSIGSSIPQLLSVEDNPETRLLLKHLLESDYEVTFTPDVDEALEVLTSDGGFDLLLVDIGLGGGKEGTALLDEIRSREDLGEIPAIAVTAYAMPGDKEELLNKGFDGYVGKPFRKADLTEAIEETLQAA